MAKSNKAIQEEVLDQRDHIRWHKAEADALYEKIKTVKERLSNLEGKYEDWLAMEDKSKQKKCVSRLRSVFRKPTNLLMKLQETGDDLLQATREQIPAYRIEKIITNYNKQREKLLIAVESAQELAEAFPEISEHADGFYWVQELPTMVDEDGHLNIITSEGIKKAKYD